MGLEFCVIQRIELFSIPNWNFQSLIPFILAIRTDWIQKAGIRQRIQTGNVWAAGRSNFWTFVSSTSLSCSNNQVCFKYSCGKCLRFFPLPNRNRTGWFEAANFFDRIEKFHIRKTRRAEFWTTLSSSSISRAVNKVGARFSAGLVILCRSRRVPLLKSTFRDVTISFVQQNRLATSPHRSQTPPRVCRSSTRWTAHLLFCVKLKPFRFRVLGNSSCKYSVAEWDNFKFYFQRLLISRRICYPRWGALLGQVFCSI